MAAIRAARAETIEKLAEITLELVRSCNDQGALYGSVTQRDISDGLIEIGSRWKKQIEGGHVKSRKYNLNSIGICLVGDFQKFRPTPKQLAAFKELTSYLKNDLLRGRPKFYVHNDLEQTLCPGKHFPKRDMHKLFG